jgi:hypothetical protein
LDLYLGQWENLSLDVARHTEFLFYSKFDTRQNISPLFASGNPFSFDKQMVYSHFCWSESAPLPSNAMWHISAIMPLKVA